MRKVLRSPGWALLGLAVVLCLGAAAPAPEDDGKLKEKALALNKITGDEPEIKKIQELIKDEAGTKKLVAVAAKMAKEKTQPFNATATFILARAAQGVKENDAAEQFYRLNIEQVAKLGGKKLALSYAGLIQLLYDTKKYADCEKTCREFLEIEPDDTLKIIRPRVDNLMILAVVKQKEPERALKMVEKRLADNKDDWLRLLKFKAELQHEMEKTDDALKTYDQIIERIKADDRRTKGEQEDAIDRVRYEMTGVYVDIKDIKKATDILQELVKKDPDNPTYNNDLGFIWADHDQKLAESEKLIRKALEEDKKKRKDDPMLDPEDDKDNPAYLDSLGWVLFKLKKYKEAKPYLEQALKDEDGQHVEIYDHLAEVQMALDEKDAAIATWKKGIEAAGASKREQERKTMIEKKLKDLKK